MLEKASFLFDDSIKKFFSKTINLYDLSPARVGAVVWAAEVVNKPASAVAKQPGKGRIRDATLNFCSSWDGLKR